MWWIACIKAHYCYFNTLWQSLNFCPKNSKYSEKSMNLNFHAKISIFDFCAKLKETQKFREDTLIWNLKFRAKICKISYFISFKKLICFQKIHEFEFSCQNRKIVNSQPWLLSKAQSSEKTRKSWIWIFAPKICVVQ